MGIGWLSGCRSASAPRRSGPPTSTGSCRKLEREGLIRRVKEEPRGGGSPRVVFEVTELGERDFGGWMRAPLAFTLIFEELLVKIAVSRPEDLPELVVRVRQRERECLAMQKQLQESAQLPAQERGWSRSTAVLLRNLGIDNLQVMAGWLQRMAVVMDREIEEQRREKRRRASRARRRKQ